MSEWRPMPARRQIAAAAPAPYRPAAVGVACVAAVVVLVRWVLQHDEFDLHIFLAAGRAVADGRLPYPTTAAQLARNSAFVYPLAAAWAFVPLSRLSVSDAELAYTVLSAAAIAAGMWLLQVRRARDAVPVMLSAFALRSITLGTVEPILFLLLALVWRYRGSPGRCGVALGAAIMLKPVVAPVLLFLVLTRRTAAAGITLATCALLWAAATGWRYSVGSYVSLLHRLSKIETDHSLSTTALLHSHDVSASAATAILVVAAAALVAAVAVAARRAGPAELDTAAYAVTVGVSVLISPIVWSHYDLLLVAPLCVLRDRTRWLWAAFAASWFVTPDRRWVVSPSHYLSWPPDSAEIWLAQIVLAAVIVLGLAPVIRSKAARPLADGQMTAS